MKVLFIGSGCACRLPFAEYLFKKKLQEADVSGIEVESADMAVWGVTPTGETSEGKNGPERVGKVLKEADFIVVMEGRQRNLLTRFMDYNSWNKIHLFLNYCKSKKDRFMGAAYADLDYPTQEEEMGDGCTRLIEQIKLFLKEHLTDKVKVPTVASV